MLEINPYYRPTASQLIESKIFDSIRVPRNEKLEPYSNLKTKVRIDHNEFKYDYEADVNPKGDQKTMDVILMEIIEEASKIWK